VQIASDGVTASVSGTAAVGARAEQACAAALLAVRDRVEAFDGSMDTSPAEAGGPTELTARDGSASRELARGARPSGSIAVRLRVPFDAASGADHPILAEPIMMGEEQRGAGRRPAVVEDGSSR